MKRVLFGGYTVLEVMIVMAISAALFFSAVVAFGGRQQEVQFNQAVRDFDSRLQDVMNDVSTGFFTNDGSFKCNVGAAPSFQVGVSVSLTDPDEQGESDACVFLGKAIQFYPQGEGLDRVKLITILGRRSIDGGGLAGTLVDSNPIGVEQTIADVLLDWGLRVTKVQSGSVDSYGAIGFFTTFSESFGGTAGATVSNNQRVQYAPVTGSQMNQDTNDVLVAIDNIATEPANEPITICLQKADQTKRAAIVIGEGGASGTSVHFDDAVVDGCS